MILEDDLKYEDNPKNGDDSKHEDICKMKK